MSSTFTTPIRVFKRNNPTNNGVIAPDNTGAAKVSQEVQLLNQITATTATGVLPIKEVGTGITTASPLIIPAGSIIQDVFIFQTQAPSALTGGVVTVNVLITNPSTGAVTTTGIGTFTFNTTGGVLSMTRTGNATAAAAAVCANVGTLDAEIQFNLTTAITGTFTGTLDAIFAVEYVARNVDGSITAYGSNYTNS
jgi:hypothetical protein